MASQKNAQQIIRKDGSNCFVEVMSTSFEIEKVLFNFYTYDTSAQAGSRLKNGINIYMSFDEFYRICHDITVTRALISEVLKMAQDAKAAGKNYAPTKIIHQGGRSAASLKAAGQGRPDNMSLARQLKIQAGSKYPIILIAESGPGEQDAKGLIVPRYSQPECKVTIPFTFESIKELFLITKAHVDAFIAAQYTYRAFHPEENQKYQKGNSSVPDAPQSYSAPSPTPQPQQNRQQYGNQRPQQQQGYNKQQSQNQNQYQQRSNNAGYSNQQKNTGNSGYGGYNQAPPPPPPPDMFSDMPSESIYGETSQFAPPPMPPDPYDSHPTQYAQYQSKPPASGYRASQEPNFAPQISEEELNFFANSATQII